LTGLRVSQTLTFGMGTAQWLAVAHTAGSTFTAAYDAGSRVRDKGVGGLEWQDSFLLLPFIPYAAPAAKTFLANAKAINGKLKNLGQMKVGSSAEPVTTPSCFVAGTEILTTEGIKNIEDIKVGDWVIADDPNTVGEIEAKQVLDAFVRHTNKLVDLYIDGELISTTEEHPFWTSDHGWVEAKDLEVGSLLQTEDGRIIDVDKIEKREGDFTVYNFKVEGFHTYFVSDLGILVHNAGCLPIPQRLEEYFRRLKEAPSARNAEEGLTQVRDILNQVEDDLSGIPRQNPPPPPNMPEGRMYPPLDDYVQRNVNGTITSRSRGHNIEISPQGDIKIMDRRTGDVVFYKQGGI
ncbi:MAG: polymorphic toxin-type HINT domain-containing protein, partial [Pseudanabaena sp.]